MINSLFHWLIFFVHSHKCLLVEPVLAQCRICARRLRVDYPCFRLSCPITMPSCLSSVGVCGIDYFFYSNLDLVRVSNILVWIQFERLVLVCFKSALCLFYIVILFLWLFPSVLSCRLFVRCVYIRWYREVVHKHQLLQYVLQNKRSFADCAQIITERWNFSDGWDLFVLLKTESDPNLGFPHTPSRLWFELVYMYSLPRLVVGICWTQTIGFVHRLATTRQAMVAVIVALIAVAPSSYSANFAWFITRAPFCQFQYWAVSNQDINFASGTLKVLS